VYNHVRLRSSRPWACCRVSWTPQYATERILREELALRGADADYIVRREAQLLIDYAVSPIVSPGAGGRAPDATGLTRDAVTGSLRLFSLLGPGHTLLLYAGNDTPRPTSSVSSPPPRPQ